MTTKSMIETLIKVNEDKKAKAQEELIKCDNLAEGMVLCERISNLENFLYQLEVTLIYM